MQQFKPFVGRSVERTGLQTQMLRCLRSCKYFVAINIPVPNGVATSGQGERLSFDVADQSLNERATCKRMLHHGEGNQQDDEHEPATECGLDDVIVQFAADGHPCSSDPGENEKPGGDQQNRAVETAPGKNQNQQQTKHRSHGKGEPCNAGRIGGVPQRQSQTV